MPLRLGISYVGESELQRLRILHKEQWMLKLICIMMGSSFSLYLLEVLKFVTGRSNDEEIWMLKLICIMMGSYVFLYLFELLSSRMGRLNGDNLWIPIWELQEPIVSVYLLHPLAPMIGRLTHEQVENACKSLIRRYPILQQEEERRQRVNAERFLHEIFHWIRHFCTPSLKAVMLKIFENENEVITALLVFKNQHVLTFKMIYDKIDYICRMEETA